MNMSIIDQA